MISIIHETVEVVDVLRVTGLPTPAPGRRRMACPIHGGRNASTFSITADGRRWRCWAGCGGGDQIDLAQAVLGLSRRQAIEYCGTLAGIEPGMVSKEELARAAARCRQRLAERKDRDEGWRIRWFRAVDALDRARREINLVLALSGEDPEERSSRTRLLLDRLGDPWLREEAAMLEVDRIEEAWRADRAGW